MAAPHAASELVSLSLGTSKTNPPAQFAALKNHARAELLSSMV